MVTNITEKIPEYNQEKHLESFRSGIIRNGENLLRILKKFCDDDTIHYYVCTYGNDMDQSGDLKSCLATIDEYILNDPMEARTLSIRIEGRERYNLGRVCLDLVERTIHHNEKECDLNPPNLLYLAPEFFTEKCGLYLLGIDIAVYYAERVKRSIEGFARLNKIIRGEERE